jgi:hypothetical protein
MVTPKFGGPELFEERDNVERPTPDPGQVLVRILAAGTNPTDTKLRADGSFAGLEPPVILGADVSGVVEEVWRWMPPDSSQKRRPAFEFRWLSLMVSLAASTHSRDTVKSGTGTAIHSARGLGVYLIRLLYSLPFTLTTATCLVTISELRSGADSQFRQRHQWRQPGRRNVSLYGRPGR